MSLVKWVEPNFLLTGDDKAEYSSARRRRDMIPVIPLADLKDVVGGLQAIQKAVADDIAKQFVTAEPAQRALAKIIASALADAERRGLERAGIRTSTCTALPHFFTAFDAEARSRESHDPFYHDAVRLVEEYRAALNTAERAEARAEELQATLRELAEGLKTNITEDESRPYRNVSLRAVERALLTLRETDEELRTTITHLERDAERLREALTFYADPQSYGMSGGAVDRIIQDAGKQAQRALKGAS